MSFSDLSGDLAKRLKKKQDDKAAAKGQRVEDKPVDFKELYALRARILGVLIRDVRQARGRTVEDCAATLRVDPTTFLSWEYGREHPSLPQLELLAYELGVPVSHFWGTDMLGGEQSGPIPGSEYIALRNRVVGGLLRQAREAASMSEATVAEEAGLTAEQVAAYEMGQTPIPLAELTSLASAVNVSVSYFLENNNRIGHWLQLQESFQQFSEMKPEIQSFISNPTNSSFIELAMWFSQLPVDDLRGIGSSILSLSKLDDNKLQAIAEGILEVTL
jgi:transcriptional regulator with XRE-family HTH domain